MIYVCRSEMQAQPKRSSHVSLHPPLMRAPRVVHAPRVLSGRRAFMRCVRVLQSTSRTRYAR